MNRAGEWPRPVIRFSESESLRELCTHLVGLFNAPQFRIANQEKELMESSASLAPHQYKTTTAESWPVISKIVMKTRLNWFYRFFLFSISLASFSLCLLSCHVYRIESGNACCTFRTVQRISIYVQCVVLAQTVKWPIAYESANHLLGTFSLDSVSRQMDAATFIWFNSKVLSITYGCVCVLSWMAGILRMAHHINYWHRKMPTTSRQRKKSASRTCKVHALLNLI